MIILDPIYYLTDHNYFDLQKMAGEEVVQFNNSIYLAEKTSVDRDFALAYFLRENKCFPPGADIKKILELYFQVLKTNILYVFLFDKI